MKKQPPEMHDEPDLVSICLDLCTNTTFFNMKYCVLYINLHKY